jgi:hypothetical protein
MTTIDDLRQRLENQYLEPVLEETPTTPLFENIDATQATFKLTPGVLSPDDESYIAPGRVLELDYELTRVLGYDASTKEVTARRGVRGSEAASHTAATCDVRFPSRWPRHLMATGIRNSLNSMWQPLFVPKEITATTGSAAYVQLPLNTVRILSVEYRDWNGEWQPVSSKLFQKHPTDPNYAAIQLGEIASRVGQFSNVSRLCAIVYGTKVQAPTLVTDEIVDLPAEWERIILADVASDMLAGVDIDATTQEYLTQQLRLERFPVKSGSSISQNLIRFKEYLIEQAKKDIEAAYPRSVYRKKVQLLA